MSFWFKCNFRLDLQQLQEMSQSTDVLSENLLNYSEDSAFSPQVSADTKNEIEELLLDVPHLDKVFTVTDKIGSGTFSSVYVAKLKEHPHIKQQFALKHIIPTSHPSRIENELRCLQEIGGRDNVIEVKACVREKDHVVIVMPYFPHEKFQDYVQELTAEEVKEYIRNLLLALGRVHQVDIIHRDVKPSNFLYNRKLKKFALVDFGLAQRAPVPIQKIVSPDVEVKAEDKLQHKADDVKSSEEKMSSLKKQSVLSPRKRKLEMIMDRENIPESPKKKRAGNVNQENTSRALPVQSEPLVDNKHIVKKTLQVRDHNAMPCPIEKPGYKSVKSPRRMILEKHALDNQKRSVDATQPACNTTTVTNHAKPAPSTSPHPANRRTVVVQRNGKQMYHSIPPSSCGCFGRPMVCTFCMSRSGERAPRAGTPGFRAPEVLMKCPDQTTAVDIWSAGVIFLSLLSGRYPFFKAADDMTALTQIISIFGSENMSNSAKSYGKNLLCNPSQPGLELKTMCEKLRGAHRSPRSKSKRTLATENSQVVYFPVEAYDLLFKLMSLDPSRRITAQDALQHPYFTQT